jgi:hypothetical protein
LIDEFIVATEDVCRRIGNKSQAAALRGEIRTIIENEKEPVSNIPKNERLALENLRKDETIVILPADKGKCLVVMDREEYQNKMEEKLADTTTYKRLEKDPTQEIRKELFRLCARSRGLRTNERCPNRDQNVSRVSWTKVERAV